VPDSRRRKSQPVMQPLLRRLDVAAENLNPILIVIIIGLSILDFSAFAALEVRHLTLHLSGSGLMQPPSLGQAIGMPQP